MVVGLLIVIVIGAILCVLAELAEDPSNGYQARHRTTERVPWLWRLRLLIDRAKAAVMLRLVVVPAELETEPDEWLPEIAAPAERQVDVLDFRPAADARFHVLAPRALDAQAHLERKGLRLRSSQFGTPELDDVWEPDLVGAR